MSPCSTSFSTIHHVRLPERDNIKLRKPLVEKMRRDRINSCIEQLKVILEKELQKQEPNVKLEKADILEMTVSFLRQQLRCGGVSSQRDYSQRGYSQCWRESLQFLSVSSKREPSSVTPPLQGSQRQHHHRQQAPHTQRTNSSSSPNSSNIRTGATTLQGTGTTTTGAVWRPW